MDAPSDCEARQPKLVMENVFCTTAATVVPPLPFCFFPPRSSRADPCTRPASLPVSHHQAPESALQTQPRWSHRSFPLPLWRLERRVAFALLIATNPDRKGASCRLEFR